MVAPELRDLRDGITVVHCAPKTVPFRPEPLSHNATRKMAMTTGPKFSRSTGTDLSAVCLRLSFRREGRRFTLFLIDRASSASVESQQARYVLLVSVFGLRDEH